MKKITLFLILSVFIGMATFAQKNWVSLSTGTSQIPEVIIQEQTTQRVVFEIAISGLYVSEIEVEGETFNRLELYENQTTKDVGKPELPMINKLIGVPGNRQARVNILEMEKTILTDYVVFPFQEPLKDGVQNNDDDFQIDRKFYSKNSSYPENNIYLDRLEVWRDVKVSGFHFIPFTYNPFTKELEVITHLKVEIEFYGADNSDVNVGAKPLTPSFYKMYDAAISNFSSLGYSMTHRGDPGIKYLVITNTETLETIQPFVDWKNEQGYKVEVRTLESGFNQPQEFKDYIAQLYESDELEYVLMVGDAYPNGGSGGGPGIVPMYYWNPSGEDASYSDSWYSCMDGPDDHYADLAIGRITYDNLGELELQMDKLMDHYFNPDVTTNWAENTILVAHKENYPDKYTLCKEQIRTFDYALQTPIFTECYGGAGAGNDDIIEFVNSTSGGIFNYRGHGSATEFWSWGSQGSFSNTHILQLTNENRLFVLFDVCCDNMDIVAHAGNCLCESFMKSPVAAIAINGAIIPSYTIPNHDYDKEMYKAVFHEGILNIGYVTNFANVTVLNVHGTIGRSNVRTYLWLGDASLEPWTLQPEEMIVNHDTQLFLGLTEYTVTVMGSGGPVENALVCVSNEERTIYSVAYTDATGMAIVQFDEAVQDPGFAMVSVSAHNYLPYQAEIPVIPLEGPYIVRDEYFINDEAGNGNGLMDYGESILLSLSMKNVGLEDATNVTVTLSSEDEYVTITTATADYGTVPAEGIVMIEDAFAFDVADNLPDGHFVLFDITATDGNDTWTSKITIPGYAPFLEIGGMDILDLTGNNNGRLDPGETADILITTINSGHSDAFELIGSLTTTSSHLTINNGSFEQDMLGSEEVTIAEFNVSVDDGIAIGTVVDMIYNIQAGSYAASKTFNTKVGLILEDWETGDFTEFDWEFGGNADWFITSDSPYEGTYCAKSGNISDQQNSELSLTYEVMADDTISFYRKVSSEANYDYLQFYIDNIMQGQWAGEVDWERVAYPVTAGPHIFAWVYGKDYSVSNGQDCGWIDLISFPPELATTAYAGPDVSICEDEDCPLSGSATYYESVEWSTSGTGTFDDNTILTPVYTPAEEDINAGEVTLTLMAYGPTRDDVSDDMTLTITQTPTAFAGEDASICEGEEFTITTASAENYTELLWATTGDGTFDDATILMPVYTPGENDIMEENVILMLTASNQPCLNAVSEFTIDINPLPTPAISGEEAACQYVEGIIYSTPMVTGSSYYWEITGGEILEGQETNEISVVWNEPGEGMLILTETNDETLCEAIVDYAVTVNEVPVPLISGNDDVCVEEADVMYNTSFVEGHTYEWSITGGVITAGANANEMTVTWEEVGEGEVLVTETISETGCMETTSMDVNVNPLPMIDLNDVSMCHNHVITLDAGNPDAQSWVWSTGETTQTIEVDSSGVGFSGTKDISVIVTSANDCASEKAIVVTIDDCSGIAENLYKLDVNLFPNPNTGTFTIELKAEQNDLLNLKIVDARGAIVYEEKEVHLNGIHTKNLNLSDMQEGIYYLLIDSDKVHVVKKVVIQR